jgi:hypothetical protein
MADELVGNSTAEPQDGIPAGESTELGELDGLLPTFDADGNFIDTEQSAEPQAAQPDGEEPAAAVTDDTEIELEDGRKATLREVKETYATFTRKTQELAAVQRETIVKARTAVAEVTEQRAQEMHLLAQQIERLVAPGYDEAAMLQLSVTDPQQWHAVRARIQIARDAQQKVQQQVHSLMQQAQQQRELADQEQQQAHQALLQAEGERLSKQKWWNADFQKQAVAFAKKHGIPEQVAGGVAYAGFVEITRKAMLYDEAMARTKGGKVIPQPAQVRPGSTPARGAMQKVKQVAGDYERARKSGDRTDIGRFLESVLPISN